METRWGAPIMLLADRGRYQRSAPRRREDREGKTSVQLGCVASVFNLFTPQAQFCKYRLLYVDCDFACSFFNFLWLGSQLQESK